MHILELFNWIDLLIVCLIIRVVYAGFIGGIFVELFKTLALAVAIFVGLHYYSGISNAFFSKFGVGRGLIDFFILGFLVILVFVAFRFIREGLLVFVKAKIPSEVDRWGGMIIAVARGVLASSLVFLMLNACDVPHIEKQLRRSFIRPSVKSFAPAVYRGIFDGIVSLIPTEQLNKAAMKLEYLTGEQ